MSGLFHHRALRAFAAFVLALAALWPGAGAAAVAAGYGDARLMCATLQPDAEGRARLAELAALAGLDAPAPAHNDASIHDCAGCFAHASAIAPIYGGSSLDVRIALKRAHPNTAPVANTAGQRAPPARPRDPPVLS